MSSFILELEKLRRRHEIGDEELKEAVKQLTRKSRGLKQQDYTGQITTARKKRRETLKTEYLKKIAELAELMVAFPGDLSACAVSLNSVPLGHLILLDIAACCLRQTSESG